MCLSNNRYPEVAITFSNTILLAAEVEVDGVYRHICGYYNKVDVHKGGAPLAQPGTLPIRALGSRIDLFDETPQLIARAPSTGTTSDAASASPAFGYDVPKPSAKPAAKNTGKVIRPKKPVTLTLGNAMLIAIPAKPGTVHGDNLVPVGKYPSFMTDYAKALVPQRPVTRGGPRSRGGPIAGVEIVSNFDNGTYDVVIADSAKKIVSAIGAVAEAKRPQLNAALYAQLDKLYPKWTFLLFCFSEATAAQAGCALVSYEPMPAFEHMLYLPGLDGHNGEIEQGQVYLNHTIVLGSYRMKAEAYPKRVAFSEPAIATDLPFLPRLVIGKIIPNGTRAPQGDFLFSTADVQEGKFKASRATLTGWAKVFGKQTDLPFYIDHDD